MAILVGTIVKEAPKTGTTGGGKKYARFTVETEKFVVIGGKRTRVAVTHKVVCFNQYSVTFLERARVGQRIRVTGEIGYDQAGKAEVQVPLYGGEVGPMDLDAQHEPSDEAVAEPTVEARQEAPKAPPPTTRPSGGFGRLNAPQDGGGDQGASHPRRLTDEELDDAIPF